MGLKPGMAYFYILQKKRLSNGIQLGQKFP
jgi:hypothetical protein